MGSPVWHGVCTCLVMPRLRTHIQLLAGLTMTLAATLAAHAEVPVCEATIVSADGHANTQELILEVAWEGDSTAWTILPPSLPSIEGIAWGDTRAVASSTENGATVTYHARVTGDPGVYTVPAISLDGLRKGEDTEPVVIASEPVELTFSAPAAAPVFPIAGGIAVGLAVLTGVFLALSRGRGVSQAVRDVEPGEIADDTDLLAIASKRRIEGDTYGFYRALADAARSDAGLVERLQRCAEDAGFRGIEVTADQMDLDYRAVERLAANRDKENEV